jgi:hypothetical protein
VQIRPAPDNLVMLSDQVIELLNSHPSVVAAVSRASKSYPPAPLSSDYKNEDEFEEVISFWRSRVGRNIGLVKRSAISAVENDANALVRITIDYGYDIHSMVIPFTDLLKASAGECFTVYGQGFMAESENEVDIWEFNSPNFSVISVSTDSARDVYDGDDCEVEWVLS